MWITKLLVKKIDKWDKNIYEKFSDETISDKDIFKKACLVGFLEGMTDTCLLIGAIQIVRGTIRLITKK